MISYYIGVTALTARVAADELIAGARALQVQVMRDFFPEWGVGAIVTAVAFNALPAGTIPIIVQDDLPDTQAHGSHRVQRDDSPYIVIPYGPNWPLAASHELLRMLANPSGSARVPGPSRMDGQGTVGYLLDVCGPCQGMAGSYAIDGVGVADFCTRGFYAGAGRVGDTMGSFAGSFAGGSRRALEPGPDGVLTWLADDGLLYQARADEAGRVRIHGGFSAQNRGGLLLGELVDRLTPHRLVRLSNAPRTPALVAAAVDARRAHFANEMRFKEDITWRFGAAPAEDRVVEPVQVVERVRRDGLMPAGPRLVADPAVRVRSPL